MNNFFNILLPRFQEKYGADWTLFKSLMDEYCDTIFQKTWAIYHLANIDTIGSQAADKLMDLLKIKNDKLYSLGTKRTLLRNFSARYKRKALEDMYLDPQESIVGIRGKISSGMEVGVWRWGISRWSGGTISSDTIRWTQSGAQFEIYFDVKTTDSGLLDELVEVFRDPAYLPAFYRIYLVDSSFNILRTV